MQERRRAKQVTLTRAGIDRLAEYHALVCEKCDADFSNSQAVSRALKIAIDVERGLAPKPMPEISNGIVDKELLQSHT